MKADSKPVQTAQIDVHPRLLEVLIRHQQHPDQTPIAEFSKALWPEILAFAGNYPGLVLDLGCGTGESTLRLAYRHSDCAVLGIDRSAHRLDKAPISQVGNHLHLRADQYDVLRLIHAHGLNARKIYLLYPNPSPKAEHLKRRWHGHPIWPTLLKVTDEIELRTNWLVYAQEFNTALQASGWQAELNALTSSECCLSLFEAKYRASGHGLFAVVGKKSF